MNKIIGVHPSPKELVGKTTKEIINWARDILKDEEPKLKKPEITAIKNGKITKIFLEPKEPGTYLPDGTFIKALDYQPQIGDDFEEAEEKWKLEDEINKWVDEENERFNEKKWSKSDNKIKDLWDHGNRIMEVSKNNDISFTNTVVGSEIIIK